MRKNTASQIVSFQAISTTDGSDVTSGSPAVYYTIDGGTQATGSGATTHEGNGQWSYAPAQAETNGNHVAFTFVLSGAVSQTVNVYPVAFDPTDAADLGVTALTGHTPQTGDSFARLGAPAGASISADIATVDGVVDSVLVDTGTTLPATLSTIEGKIDTVDGNVDAVLLDTNSLETDWADGGRLDLILDARASQTSVDTVDSNVDAILVDTGTTLPATLSTMEGKIDTVDGVADSILVDTADMQPKIGTLSNLGSGATLADNLADVAGGTFSTATDSLEAIRNRGDSAWTTGGGGGGSDRLLLADTTIASLTSQTEFTLTAGAPDNDAYNGCTIVVEDASTSTQKAVGVVDDYVGSSKTVTLLQDPGIFTMAATDKVYILAEKSLKPTSAQNYHVDVTSGGTVGIDWSNVENPSSSVDLAATDIRLCDTTTTNSDMRGTDSALLASSAPSNFSDLAITSSSGKVTVGTNDDKTGYALTQSFPSNFASLGINASGHISRVTLCDTTTTNSDMRGTDSANTTTPPTAAAVRAEIDSNSTKLASIEGDTQDLQTQIGTAGAGLTDLGGMSTGMKAEVNAEADTALTDYDAPTKAEMDSAFATTDALITTVDGVVDSILLDTAEIGAAGAGLTAVPYNSAWDAEIQSEVTDALNAYDPPTKTEMDSAFSTTDALVTTVDGVVDGIATTLGTAGAGLTDLGGMSTAMKAEVNAEALDVLQTDTPVAGQTIVESLRRIGTIASGKVSNAGTGTETFTPWDNGSQTIVITVDSSGNRSGVTYN